jgi:hypothetical protein
MATTIQEKASLTLWWGIALSITIYLFIGVVNTASVIVQ